MIKEAILMLTGLRTVVFTDKKDIFYIGGYV